MITTVCILGNHIQSLGIVRIAGRLGYKVILINDGGLCIARFSQYCSEFVVCKTNEALLDELVRRSEQTNNILLMPTSDEYIKFIINNYDVLAQRFLLSTPVPSVLNICYNKKLTYQKAHEMGIPIPMTYFPTNLDELTEISNEISYPVIIKPAIMHMLFEKTGKKVYACRDRDELLKNYSMAAKIVDPSELTVQKLIKGRAGNLYSYCSFFANGVSYGSFIAHRIRQKPMDFGVSTTFAVSVKNEKIEETATRFLKGIDYFGLSEVEFMYDPDDNEYKLIEINPRTWKWHSIANKLGINLIKMLIDHLERKHIDRVRNGKENIGWIESITDTYVVVGELLRRRMSVADYLRTLSLRKEFACFDADDLLPALSYLVFSPCLFFTR